MAEYKTDVDQRTGIPPDDKSKYKPDDNTSSNRPVSNERRSIDTNRNKSRDRSKYRSHDHSKHRSRSRDKHRYRSRSRSRNYDKYQKNDRSSNKKGEVESKKVYSLTKQTKRSAWDSMKPVSSLSAELCDTRSILDNKGESTYTSTTPRANDSASDDPSSRKIYIGSLDYEVTEDDIRTIFSAFGEITSIDMPRDPSNNKSKGYCFVEYSKKDYADLATVSMQGFQIKGRPIKLGKASANQNYASGAPSMIPGYANTLSNPLAAGALAAASFLQNRGIMKIDTATVLNKIGAATSPFMSIGATPPEMNGRRVQLENIPFELSAQDVKKIFEPFGTIINCVLIPKDLLPGSFYGCGYIDYESPNVAEIVCSTMNGFEIAGTKVQVTMAPPSTNASNVIILCNMVDPNSVDEELSNEVKEECSKYGHVTSVYLHFTPSNEISIFVVFNTAQDADNAINALNSRWFNGRQIKCRLYDANAYFSGNYDL